MLFYICCKIEIVFYDVCVWRRGYCVYLDYVMCDVFGIVGRFEFVG